MGNSSAVVLILIGLCIFYTSGCLIQGYVDMSVMERFVQSKYVVYGRTINHQPRKSFVDGKKVFIIDAVFEVSCVFKKWDDQVEEIITISGIAPRDDCSGTLVQSIMRVGEHAIIALTKSRDGSYDFDEIMPKTSAAVIAYKPYFFSLARICGMQTWEAPVGAGTNKCPLCGTKDFDSEIQSLDNSQHNLKNCLSTQSSIVTNMTECDLYMEYSIDESNTKTCVPVTNSQTCTTLLFRTSAASCDCNPKKEKPTLRVGAGVTIFPSAFMIVVVLFSLLKNIEI